MNQSKKINKIRQRRQKRVRFSIKGGAVKPRLSVFRSYSHIYAQLIDDASSKTLASASSMEIKGTLKKSDVAKEVGKIIAQKAGKLGIKIAVFDRNRYSYHGRVKAVAEGAREGGLKL